MMAFADKYGFPLSKRLIDAEIARSRGPRASTDKFSEHAYQQFLAQQRLTDAEVRADARRRAAPAHAADPGRDQRRGCRLAWRRPMPRCCSKRARARRRRSRSTSSALGSSRATRTCSNIYSANRGRYMVPRAARAADRAHRPGAGRRRHGIRPGSRGLLQCQQGRPMRPSDTRSLSQVVVQDQATANAIAAARQGRSDSRRCGGAGGRECRRDHARRTRAARPMPAVAGDKAAAAVFAAPAGRRRRADPVRLRLGRRQGRFGQVQGGKTLDQARAEIAAKLNADKRKAAIEDLVDKVQNAIDDGSNFTEAAAQAKLAVTTTPLITADGTSRTDADLQAARRSSRRRSRPGSRSRQRPARNRHAAERRRVMRWCRPAQVVPPRRRRWRRCAIRSPSDWIRRPGDRARPRGRGADCRQGRARDAACAGDEGERGRHCRRSQPVAARRIQIAMAQGNVPPALKMLFTLGQGKSRMAADPKGAATSSSR